MSPLRTSFFHKKEYSQNRLSSVATVAYTLNPATGQLKYGATIYKRDEKTPVWCRKEHNQQASDRLKSNPVIVEFGPINVNSYNHIESAYYRRLEQYIRNECLPQFGVENRGNQSAEQLADEATASVSLKKSQIFETPIVKPVIKSTSNKVLVTNLPPSIKPGSEIHVLFDDVGSSAVEIKFIQGGSGTNSAIVTFPTQDQATVAIKNVDGKIIFGNTLCARPYVEDKQTQPVKTQNVDDVPSLVPALVTKVKSLTENVVKLQKKQDRILKKLSDMECDSAYMPWTFVLLLAYVSFQLSLSL